MQEDGSDHLDPSALDCLRELRGADPGDDTPSVPPARMGAIALLRERLAEQERTRAAKDRLIHHRMQERDAWRAPWKKHLGFCQVVEARFPRIEW